MPEPISCHTRDPSTLHPSRLVPSRPASVPAPARERARVPPSGGCPAAREHTSQPSVPARPSVPRRHTLVSRPLSRPASPTLLSTSYPSVSPACLPHAERDRLPASVQSCPSCLQPRATDVRVVSTGKGRSATSHDVLVAFLADDERFGARIAGAWVCFDVDSLCLGDFCVTVLVRAGTFSLGHCVLRPPGTHKISTSEPGPTMDSRVALS